MADHDDEFLSLEELGEFEHQDDLETDQLLEENSETTKDESKSSELLNTENTEDTDGLEDFAKIEEIEEIEVTEETEDFTEVDEIEGTDLSINHQLESDDLNANLENEDAFNDAEEFSDLNNQSDHEITNDEISTDQEDHHSFEELSENNFDTNFDDTSLEASNENDDTEDLEKEDGLEIDKSEIELKDKVESTPIIPLSSEKVFSDVKDFSNNFNYAKVSGEGNPPYSIILDKIKYKEDADYILNILKEYQFINQTNQDLFQQGLTSGSLLIPRISEYAAVFLAHKFRKIELDLKMGLSQEIHPPQKNYTEDKGLVNKVSIRQNTEEEIYLEHRIVEETREILTSTTNSIEGYDIIKYLDIISAHSFLSTSELERWQHQTNQSLSNDHYDTPNLLYSKLVDDLKNISFKIEADAVVGIHFSITPVITNINQNENYKLTATGTAIVLKKSHQ